MNILQKSSTPKYLNKKGAGYSVIIFTVLALLLLICFVFSLLLGSAAINPVLAIKELLKGDFLSTDFKILFYLRLPRALGGLLAGSALGVAGTIVQGVLANPLASPGTIGVNAGAGLGAVILIAIFPSAVCLIPLGAFLGGVGALLIILAINSKKGCGKISLILVGIAVGSTLTAAQSLIKSLFPDAAYDATLFSVGTLSGLSFKSLFPSAYLILGGVALCFILTRALDLLSLGEAAAHSLGVRVKKLSFLMLLLAAILASCAVSFSGLLGFVGLIAPHIGRKIVGGKHSLLVPFCALFGGFMVLLSDLLARTLFTPYEIPVGIILSFIGCPFFVLLIISKRN